MEIVNIVDRNGKHLRNGIRGEKLNNGEYSTFVHIWIYTRDGKLLVQQRSASCEWKPLMWATHGGASLAGEDFVKTAQREILEEIGLDYELSAFEKGFRVIDDEEHLMGEVFFTRYSGEAIKIDFKEVLAYDFLSFDVIIDLVLKGEFISYFNINQELNETYWKKVENILERRVGKSD